MVNTCLKRCSTSLFVMEMQNKTTRRRRFISLDSWNQKTDNNKRLGETGTLRHGWWNVKWCSPKPAAPAASFISGDGTSSPGVFLIPSLSHTLHIQHISQSC